MRFLPPPAQTTLAESFTINADFKSEPAGGHPLPTYVGVAAAPDLGTHWNRLERLAGGGPTSAAAGLLDSMGNPTSVLVDYPGPPPGALVNDIGGPYANLLGDMLLATGDPNPFVIHGLPANKRYTLYAYSAWATAGLGAQFTVAGSYQGVLQAVNTDDVYTLVQGENYVVFTGITSDTGDITGTYDRLPGRAQGLFNGFQLTIPEPATILLLLFAATLQRR